MQRVIFWAWFKKVAIRVTGTPPPGLSGRPEKATSFYSERDAMKQPEIMNGAQKSPEKAAKIVDEPRQASAPADPRILPRTTAKPGGGQKCSYSGNQQTPLRPGESATPIWTRKKLTKVGSNLRKPAKGKKQKRCYITALQSRHSYVECGDLAPLLFLAFCRLPQDQSWFKPDKTWFKLDQR